MKKHVKFTELLVDLKPYEYDLKPYIARQNKQFQFEQSIPRSETLIPVKPRQKVISKIQHDYTQYIPLEYVSWEDDLEMYLKHREKKKEVRDDLSLKLLFDNLLCEVWETRIDKPAGPLKLYYQDPNLIFTTEEKKKKKARKYNLSNDKYYITKKKRTESLLNLGVQHSIIALRLHRDFYPTHLTDRELVNFHRNYFSLPPEIKFVTKGKISHTFIRKPEELTIEDGCNFCIVEYCEEYPLLVNNPGMVSVIEWFRREDKEDELKINRSNETFFSTTTLGNSDPSPLPIANIKAGKSNLIISNNLFKAPLFEQNVNVFIVTVNGSQSTIRCVEHILTAGQIFPIVEVFSPHSKTLNSYCRNRLKLASSTFTNKNIRMKDLDDMFPSFSEGSKRKWLKEFTERRAISGTRIEDIQITPENVCQYESMLVGEKLIKDGIIESNNAPWNLAKNFIKGMIEVVGKGESTRECFSFLKGTKENFEQLVDERWRMQEQILTSNILFDDLLEDEKERMLRSVFDINEGKDIEKDIKENQAETQPTINLSQEENKTSKSFKGIKIIRVTDGIKEIEMITDKNIIKSYLSERKKIRKDEKKIQLKCGGCGQVGHMKTNKTCPNYVDESKLTKKKREALRRKMKNILCESILVVLNKMFSLPYSSAFHKPVNVKKFPNYLNFVQQPIDLSTIRTKAKLHRYYKYGDFVSDIRLLCDNCYKYNGPEHSFTKVSQEMLTMAEEWIRDKEDIKNAEMIVNNPDYM